MGHGVVVNGKLTKGCGNGIINGGGGLMSGVRDIKKQAALIERNAIEYVDNLELIGDNANLIKRVVKNVYMWSSGGKSDKEIAEYLTLTKKEFNEMLREYPEVLGALVKGQEFANMLLSMSVYEMAIGKKTTRKQTVSQEQYIDPISGEKLSRPVTTWVEEEIPPAVRLNAAKFLLEAKQPEEYGKLVKSADECEYSRMFKDMTNEEKKALVLVEKKAHLRTIELAKKDK